MGIPLGPGGVRSPCHHCSRGISRRGRRNPGICHVRRCRLAFHRRHRPIGARAVPTEAATPTLYLRGSDGRRDPLYIAGGVPGVHQGGRPSGALPVPVGREGSMPQGLIWICGHAACMWSPVHVCAWGSFRQSPERIGLPFRGGVLMDYPPGRRKFGRRRC